MVAYPLLVLALTHSPAKAGLVGFAESLPAFLFTLAAGDVAGLSARPQDGDHA